MSAAEPSTPPASHWSASIPPASTRPANLWPGRGLIVATAAGGLAAFAAGLLWAVLGGRVFFETIASGFSICF